MRRILSAPQMPLLAQLGRERTLLAFDFDGTLAPIVSEPWAAEMRPTTRQLLASVSQRYPVAVVSGRARADVRQRLGPAVVPWIVGNHGAEAAAAPGAVHPLMPEVRRRLAVAIAAHPGAELEDKGHSLAVHVRGAERRVAARRDVERVVAAFGDALRIIPGWHVANIVAAGAPTKGDAVARLRREADVDRVLFVGDDVTDEDVFRLPGADWLVGVRVGRSARTAARYYLARQAEIDRLLSALLERRPSPSS